MTSLHSLKLAKNLTRDEAIKMVVASRMHIYTRVIEVADFGSEVKFHL